MFNSLQEANETKKREVISKLCKLSTHIMEKEFGCKHSADCFCGDSITSFTFEFSPEILNFIEEAIEEKLQRDAK